MAPFGGERGFGVRFLGIDLPHPEQPLRFWGRACP